MFDCQLELLCDWSVAGYGFVDFELAEDAVRAVTALQSQGIQAQMAKVSYCKHAVC